MNFAQIILSNMPDEQYITIKTDTGDFIKLRTYFDMNCFHLKLLCIGTYKICF